MPKLNTFEEELFFLFYYRETHRLNIKFLANRLNMRRHTLIHELERYFEYVSITVTGKSTMVVIDIAVYQNHRLKFKMYKQFLSDHNLMY